MSPAEQDNPALEAAKAADEKMLTCLAQGRSFLLEAGAGAGKTYSLVAALKFLISNQGRALVQTRRRIACITYTNAATAVINSRIDGNAAVFTDTIHSFCWSVLKGFQSVLRSEIPHIPAWKDRLENACAIQQQAVEYDLGFRKITEDAIALHHDDVLILLVALLKSQKFRRMLAQRYPYILIDEYQDTNSRVMTALKEAFLDEPGGIVIGLFGDHWQRIYDHTCGHVSHVKIEEIGKGSNFRSATRIVDVLNNMRPELPQAPKDPGSTGTAQVFHTNRWKGARRTGAGGGHWKGDLPSDVAHAHLSALISTLKDRGWDMSPECTKILMLTHGVLADEQGYRTLLDVFPYNDSLMKKEDEFIAFFGDKVEPACEAFSQKRYGDMFVHLGESAPKMQSYADKAQLSRKMQDLITLRETGTVGNVLDLMAESGFPRLPEPVFRRDKAAREFVIQPGQELPTSIDIVRKLREVPYTEVRSLLRFIDGHTPFATKHSVKGDEFQNVLIVIGRGWNRYNFDQYLSWARTPGHVPENRWDAYERNRNLFYVSCSRPTTNLALLFTQELSTEALDTLKNWFTSNHVSDFSLN